jgi:hypothetical protein
MKGLYKLGKDALIQKKLKRRSKIYMEFKHLQHKFLDSKKDLSED